MDRQLEALIEERKSRLLFYNPYNYLKALDQEAQFRIFVKEKIATFGTSSDKKAFYSTKDNQKFVFLYQFLEWDSNFLKKNTFKLYTVLYAAEDAQALITAIQEFKKYISIDSDFYLFIDIPSEDIFLIQCLGYAGFKLTETRLHFFKDNIGDFESERYPVRLASISDAEIIGTISCLCRNDYDRLHADIDFPNELADEYLNTYAMSSVKGYCDAVIVPDEREIPLQSFLAISLLKEDSALLQCPLARVVLTAVAPANKGWHRKLVSETIYYAKEKDVKYVLMTTQSTNKAVFRTSEILKFKLGSCTHILSYSSHY